MPKTITIPDIGDVDFPDDMSDEQIVQAIERDIVPSTPRAKAKTFAPPVPKLRQNLDYVMGTGKPDLADAAAESGVQGGGMSNPLNFLRSPFSRLYQYATGEVGSGAKDIASGEVSRGTRKVLAGAGTAMAPMLAPALVAAPATVAAGMGAGMVTQPLVQMAGEKLGLSKDQAGLAGDLAATVTGGMVGKRVHSRMYGPKLPAPFAKPAPQPQPTQAAAVAELMSEGIKPNVQPKPTAPSLSPDRKPASPHPGAPSRIADAITDDAVNAMSQSVFGRAASKLSADDLALVTDLAKQQAVPKPPGSGSASTTLGSGFGSLNKMFDALQSPGARKLLNVKTSDISAEEQLALARTTAKVALTEKIDPFAVESHEAVAAVAKQIDPENASAIIANIKASGINTRAALLAFRQRINQVNSEVVDLVSKLNDHTIPLKERASLKAAYDQKDKDLKGLLGHYLGISTEHGRTLAAYKIEADATWDLTHWLGRVRRANHGILTPETQQQVQTIIAEGAAAKTPEAAAAAKTKLAELASKQHENDVWDTFISLHKAGLLGPRTHLTNMGATTASMVMEDFARGLGSIADMAIGAVTGKRTVSDLPMRSAKAAIDAVRFQRATPERYSKLEAADAIEGIRDQSSVGLGKYGNKISDLYQRFTFGALKAADRTLKKVGFEKSIDEQARLIAKNELISAKRAGSPLTRQYATQRYRDLKARPTDEMTVQAIYDAQVATFNNENMLATGWSRFKTGIRQQAADSDAESAKLSGVETTRGKDAARALTLFMDFTVPFPRTPSNVAKRTLDYTVGAPIKLGKEIIGAAMHGMDANRQKAISESIGRGTVGAAMLLYGFFKAQRGEAVGLGVKKDSDKALDEASGAGPGRIKVFSDSADSPGHWVKINHWAPGGSLISIGATLFEQYADRVGEAAAKDPDAHLSMLARQANPAEAASTTMKVIGPSLLDMPMVKGISDTVSVLQDRSKGGTTMNRFLASQAGSMVPFSAWVNEIGSAGDTTMRETGADDPADAIKRGLMSRIPGLRQQLPARVDILGRGIPTATPADPFLSQRDRSHDPVIAELRRLDIPLTHPDYEREESMNTLRKRVDRDYTGAEQTPGETDADYIKRLAGVGVIRATRSRDEQYLIQDLAGNALRKQLEAAVASPAYAEMTDSAKTDALQSLIRDLRRDLSEYFKSAAYQSLDKPARLEKIREINLNLGGVSSTIPPPANAPKPLKGIQ